MLQHRARWFWGVGLLVVGLIAGIILTSSIGVRQPIVRSLGTPASSATPGDSIDQDALRAVKETSRAFEQIAKEATPSVVTITSERMVHPSDLENSPFHDFFGNDFMQRFFGGQQSFRQRGLGSGVIISSDGYILTNNHVVGDADKLQVILSDESTVDAKVIGTDPESDLAVIKIDDHGLPAAHLGDSKELRVGEWVLAIGSPFQLQASVTLGIVSATGRSNVGLAPYEDFIQTDAAINPGNSGGALVNLDGEVIGINTAIATNNGGYQGVGFAIPIDMARNVMDQLIKSGKVTRGFLGVTIQDLDSDTAKSLGLKSPEGALIAQMASGGPAEKAGLEVGDVILKYNGSDVKNVRDLMSQVAATAPGRETTVTVWRDNKERDYDVKVSERPAGDEVAQQFTGGSSEQENGGLLGLTVEPITPDIADKLQVDPDTKGVVVSDVDPNGPASEAGVRAGDIIRRVNKSEISSMGDFRHALNSVEEGDTVLLLLERDGRTFFRPLHATGK